MTGVDISTGERNDRWRRVAPLLATGVIMAAAAGLLWNAASRRATGSVTLELTEPLQGRPVMDGASGQRRRVSDAATLLTPSWLPYGYRLARQYVESNIDVREWARDDRPDERLTIERGSFDEIARPGYEPMVLDEPTVRGVPATVWKSRGFDDLVCVSWAEDGDGHRVCSGGTPGHLLANDVLVRVADGLRDHDARRPDPRPSDVQTAVTDPDGT